MGGCPYAPQPVYVPQQPVMTIAPMDTLTGRWAGLWERRHGAAKFMGKDAPARLAVQQHPNRTIALQVLPTGCPVGALARRRGVARTRARAAHQQQEDALDFDIQWACCILTSNRGASR